MLQPNKTQRYDLILKNNLSRSSNACSSTIPGTYNKGISQDLSSRGLVLALKTVQAREVRERGREASVVAEARLTHADLDEQVVRARARERAKRTILRSGRRDVIHGDAVAEANQVRRTGRRVHQQGSEVRVRLSHCIAYTV